ncbi:Cytochrome c oxidase assembly protein CtaG/Cox11 [Gracilaria domingensis]|nr:Cytochrome c oxidase assembly protein CtaG/Cox11 [Gracilaria domingensis]
MYPVQTRSLFQQLQRRVSRTGQLFSFSAVGGSLDSQLLVVRKSLLSTRPSRLHSTSTRTRNEFRGARRSPEREAAIRERNRNFAAWAAALALATVGLSYASVPLYRVFCQVTGFGGTVRTKDGEDSDGFITAIDEAKVVEDRPIKIRFNADISAHVPWRFTPLQSEVVVLPGETALAFYAAKNLSAEPITGIATYNVTPAKAAIYFNKVQCFCFDEQRLKPGEALDMPVFFYIDPEFASDENMADVKDIMLSYTFFKAEDVTPEQLQRAQAAAMGK